MFTPFVAKAFFACWCVLPVVLLCEIRTNFIFKFNQYVSIEKFLLVGGNTMECVLSMLRNRCQSFFRFLSAKSQKITTLHMNKKTNNFTAKFILFFRSNKFLRFHFNCWAIFQAKFYIVHSKYFDAPFKRIAFLEKKTNENQTFCFLMLSLWRFDTNWLVK